jgi:hypothetical protein
MPGKSLIEWLTSKIGVLIAIGVVTAFVLGLFSWQHSMAVDNEGQGVADSISAMLDSVGTLEATIRVNVSFGNSPGQLPEKIGGRPYSINITTDSVIITSERGSWISRPVVHVIPENLTERTYNLTGFAALEYNQCTGEFPSSGNLIVERAMIDVSGETRYITLAYRPEN